MKRIGRAVGSVLLLGGIVGGIPALLIGFVGSPFPTTWPAPGAVVEEVQRSGVTPATAVKLVAVVVWVAWARLALALLVEGAARYRNRPTPEYRGLGSAQRWAASLLASASLVAGGLGSVRGAGAASPTHPESVVRAWSGGGLAAETPMATEATWTVARNDSWWRIAERALGDGLRWRDVASVNLGREVAPGVVLTSIDQTIHPGWTLVLPAPTGVAPTARADAPSVTVEAGDTLASIAGEQLGSPDRWPLIWDTNEGRAFTDGHRFEDPDRILPGWVLVLPEAPASPAVPPAPRFRTPGTIGSSAAAEALDSPTAATSAAPVPCLPGTAAVPGPPLGEPIAPGVTGGGDGDDAEAGASAPLGLGAATLLASAGVGLVHARRRQRLRAARRRSVVVEPAAPVIEFEQQLRAVSRSELVARVDLAVRGAVGALVTSGSSSRLLGVTIDPAGELVVLFDGVGPAAELPFVSGTDGWVLPARVALGDIPSGSRYAPFPCPALVQLGRAGERDVYLDLEALGLLALDGSRRATRAILHHLAASVALAPFGTTVGVVAAGVDAAITELGPAAEHFDGLESAIDRVAGLATPLLGVLRPGQTAAAIRATSAGEPWEPVVLVAGADSVVDHLGADLVGLAAEPGRGVAIVADSPGLRARWKLLQLESAWRLEPLGLELHPVGLAGADLRALGALVGGAGGEIVVASTGPEVVAAPSSAGSAPVDRDPAPAFVVRTFGRPRVTTPAGTEVEFARAKALELVVWLARHRNTATRLGARHALWETDVANGTFANVVSDARHALAAIATPEPGSAWISRTLGERLELDPAVVSDVELVERHLTRARRQPPLEARRTLALALDLIGGAPYLGAPYLWPDAEGAVSHDTLLATTVAAEHAELALAADDLEGVFASTAVGLTVLPGHEELLALRMRAHAARGDLAAVRKEWEGYERIIAGDPLGDGEPSPRLVRLRNDLLGTRRPAVA